MLKKLNLFDSSMLVMGSMIGSGIFIVSSQMARELGSPSLLLLAWIITAVLTITAALCYGELAAAMPQAGGQYVYLREAYGKLTGFLYGWTLFTVIQTGTIAAVAVAFARYTGVLFPVISEQTELFSIAGWKSVSPAQVLAIAIIFILSFSNFRPIKSGAFLQNVFTMSKIIALVAVIIAGLYAIMQGRSQGSLLETDAIHSTQSFPGIGLFCAALVGSIFSSDAWNNITFTAGEIDQPGKNIPRSLLIGTGGVLVMYIFINCVYLYALPFSEIQHAASDRVGTRLMQEIAGNAGAGIMAILIMVSTFGCINGLSLSGARVYYAMAKDQLFFKQAASLHANGSPRIALMMQAIWASLLTLSGSYGDLLDYVVFAVLLFYILSVLAVFILRKTQPHLHRPYRVFAYPILPIVYIIMATCICISLFIYKPNFTYPGLIIVLSGIPVYWLLFRNKKVNVE